MTKRLLALVALVALVTAGCGNNEEATPEGAVAEAVLPVPSFEPSTTMSRIQHAGKVKIGVKYDQPGFGFQNTQTQQLEGFDIEIAKMIAQGIFGGTITEVTSRIEFVQAVSRNREPFIQNGTVDMVIATYSITDARKALVDFAGPYYLAHGDVMVKATEQVIRTVPDLNGRSVCIAKNSTYEQSIREKAPQAVLVPQDTYAQCTAALKNGTAQALATDNVILAGLAQASGGEFKLLGTSFTDEPYGIGITKGDTVFRSFLNTRLKAIEDNGRWRTAFEETLGKFDLPTPQPPPIDFTPSRVAPATTTTSVTVSPPR